MKDHNGWTSLEFRGGRISMPWFFVIFSTCVRRRKTEPHFACVCLIIGHPLSIPYRKKFPRINIPAGKVFLRTKLLAPTRNFGIFVRRKKIMGFLHPHSL